MDIVLRKITCDDSLPVSVVENTFQITCEGSDRCAFRRDTSALLSGQFVLNGFENNANGGNDNEDGTSVVVAGVIDTQAGSHQVRQTVDLCSSVTGYASNGNECPGSGTYDFSADFDMLMHVGWWGTGFGATGDFEMVAHDGTLIGLCTMNFDTPVHGVGIPSNIVFISFIAILGLVLFVAVFLTFGQQVFSGELMKRRMRYNDDDSTITKGTAKTVLSGYAGDQDDHTLDATIGDSVTYDDATRTSVSKNPGGTYKADASIYTSDASLYTYDASIKTADTSTYTYATGMTSVQGLQSVAGEALAKAWRLGGLVVERIVKGKPLRTPPQQLQAGQKMEDESKKSVFTFSDYYLVKDEAPKLSASNNQNKMHNNTIEDGYKQMDEENSVELTAASSSYSDIDLNDCDSMEVQATHRTRRFACGAGDSGRGAVAVAVESVQAVGKGWMDTSWLMNNTNTSTQAPAPQQQDDETRDANQDMKVYTIRDGDNGALYKSSSSDDSTRDDSVNDDSSIVPAAPRRQAVRFGLAPENQPVKVPASKTRMAHSDSLSVHTVVHGSRVDGNNQMANQKSLKHDYSKGSFVRWEDQAQWKRNGRNDRFEKASLNRFDEL